MLWKALTGIWVTGAGPDRTPRQGYGAIRSTPAVFRMRSDVSGLLSNSERVMPPVRRQYSAEIPYPGMVDSGHMGPDGYMPSPMVSPYTQATII